MNHMETLTELCTILKVNTLKYLKINYFEVTAKSAVTLEFLFKIATLVIKLFV